MRFNQFILAGGLAIGLAVLTAQAQAVGNLIDVGVYDRAENRTLPVYFHGGRYYVVGKPGNEYQVTIRNRQSDDVMTVVSVDGVNAVSGETAHWSQTGYVFGAGASYAISGWRKSLQRVARFYFTELENSYAARSSRPDNVGVKLRFLHCRVSASNHCRTSGVSFIRLVAGNSELSRCCLEISAHLKDDRNTASDDQNPESPQLDLTPSARL